MALGPARRAPRRRDGTTPADARLGRVLRRLLLAEPMSRESGFTEDAAARLVRVGRDLVADAESLVGFVPADSQDQIRVIAASGRHAESILGRTFPLAGTLAERAIASKAMVASRDVAALGDNPGLESPGHNSALTFSLSPEALLDGRRSLGVFTFYRAGQKGFTPDERAVIEDFARMVRLSMYRATLYLAMQEQSHRLEGAMELAVKLAGSLDPGAVVRQLLESTVESVHADRGTLSRLEQGEIVVEDSYDRLGPMIPIGTRYRMPISGHLLEAVKRKQPVLAGPYPIGAGGPEAIRSALVEVRHTLTMPLLLQGEVVAVLVLSRRRDPAFGAPDVTALELVANIAVLALRNAWLYSNAQEANRAKSDFLNMAAHELRTPLTVISGYLSLLLDGTLGEPPASWAAPLEVVADKARELGVLVDDLLMAGRLESGVVRSRLEHIDLRDLARASVSRANPRARLLGGKIHCEVPSRPVLAYADPAHVGRMLDNLINNALSYTTEPWVKVTVEAKDGGRISVEDRGVGIPPEMQERVFERFVRLENPDLGFQAGTGLGLSIGRELARQQGGDLVLDRSEPGQGSRFTIVIRPA